MTVRGFLWSLLLAGVCGVSLAASARVDFTLPDLDGHSRSLSEFRGKWVLVNYWATWCPPCRAEMPELELFHNAHNDRDAVVLGVNMQRTTDAKLRAFVEDQFTSYPIVRDRPRPRTELGPVPGLPTSYLVDPQGRVVARQLGPITAADLERFLKDHGGGEPSTKQTSTGGTR